MISLYNNKDKCLSVTHWHAGVNIRIMRKTIFFLRTVKSGKNLKDIVSRVLMFIGQLTLTNKRSFPHLYPTDDSARRKPICVSLFIIIIKSKQLYLSQGCQIWRGKNKPHRWDAVYNLRIGDDCYLSFASFYHIWNINKIKNKNKNSTKRKMVLYIN